ncbi:hypothetical protein BC937DRAFT_93694 [Endogone sp. FLAS-F59071]|nr:hypothetical protein BC937DRAFT_93694 [Endogone sp. FLAS-F59071]|eukprot:RUS21092.1 hypothetical protein BC937DRAFT_93694 [Endogone sp. FLAS-F59071]
MNVFHQYIQQISDFPAYVHTFFHFHAEPEQCQPMMRQAYTQLTISQLLTHTGHMHFSVFVRPVLSQIFQASNFRAICDACIIRDKQSHPNPNVVIFDLHRSTAAPQHLFHLHPTTYTTMFQTIARHIDESLENENWYTLNKMVLAQLVGLCQERNLPTEGDKNLLIQLLLDYKDNVKPVPAPSTPHLMISEPSTSAQLYTLSALNFQSIFQGGPDVNGPGTGEIPYEKLEIGKKLGSGGFKDCFAGVYLGEPVAIGELRLTQFTDLDIQEIRNEIGVLKQLRHENIIRFIGVCSNPKHLSIITELCENGDLFDYMRRVRKPNFTQQVMFMHDISLGVSYLHTRRPSIIHRISANLRAKINDFGLARIRPRANASLHTQCGTPNWYMLVA